MFYTLFVTNKNEAIVTETEQVSPEAEKQLLEANGYKPKALMRAERFAKAETLQVWLDYCGLGPACLLKASSQDAGLEDDVTVPAE